VSDEEKRAEYFRRIGENMVQYCSKLIQDKEGVQCQLGAPLLHKMAVGADNGSSVPVSALSDLLDCEKQVVQNMIKRGIEEKLELVTDQARPKSKRGTYVPDEGQMYAQIRGELR